MMAKVDERQTTVLLADDNDASRDCIMDALGRSRFRFFEADHGLEAVRIAETEPIDLSILDMHMPDMSGLDVLRMIHQFKQAHPCIMISAACTKELVARALDEGAYTMLDKPLSAPVLRYTVRLIIEKV